MKRRLKRLCANAAIAAVLAALEAVIASLKK